MLRLSDFFQPLNLVTISYFFGLFLFLDVIGTFLRIKILKLDEKAGSRIINWILGLAFFIFVWFLLSLFLTPGRSQILISIVILTILTLPSYIKAGAFTALFKELWNLRVPILIISLFLPAIFVKASLPPYYTDEIAYHYIAPSALNYLAPIRYGGDIYLNLPRTLDLFWQLIFTLFHTYSVARLCHFTILVTGMIYAYCVLKKNFGLLPAFLFVFVFFSLPQDIVLTSTLGYVDVGAYSFLLMGLMSLVNFFMSKSESSLILAFSFWAMNLGTKYTGVSSFVSFLIVLPILILGDKKIFYKLFARRLLVYMFIVFMIFGGYWYLKNFIMHGNPIYPFLLPCWGSYSSMCPTTSSFFGDWTSKINLVNAHSILSQLFPKHIFVQLLVVASPFLAIFGANKKTKLIILFSYFAVLVELLILKYISGFYIRYQQHLQLYFLLGLVLTLSNKYNNRLVKICVKLCLLFLITTSFFLFIYTLRYTFSNSLGWNEINYSIGKMSIYDWIKYYPGPKYTAW